jgi:hypothetical protein
MPRKQIVDREKSARAVVAAGETHANATGQKLAALCKPYLAKGEKMPDFALGMRLVARLVGQMATEMVTADEAHEAELGDDGEPRRNRDELAAKLFERIVGLREVMTGVYGAATTAKVFVGATPQDPTMLARYAGEAAKALAAIKLPAPRVPGAKLDAKATAAELVAAREELETELANVAREAREAEATKVARDAATSRYDEVFAGSAGAISALLRLAGDKELASRVRPSTRRPGQVAEADPASPAEPAPAPVP